MWVPRRLSEKNKTDRVVCANEIIQLIENKTSTDLLRRWAVEDQSWILYNPFFSKQENKVWTKSSLPRPRVIRPQFTNRKTLLVSHFTCLLCTSQSPRD